MSPALRVFIINASHALIATLLLAGNDTVAQSASGTLRIVDGFRLNGALRWTNDVITTTPIYEILRSATVTGA